MQNRIAARMTAVMNHPRQISLERALLYKESLDASNGQPEVVRRARAFAHMISRFAIAIHPGEILVGGRTVNPRAGVISADLGVDWLMEELDTISTRSVDPFDISDEQKQIYRDVLYPYYHGRDMRSTIDEALTPEQKSCMNDRIFRLNQTDKGQGHILPDYAILLNRGIGSLIEELTDHVEADADNSFYKAALISCKAMQHLVDRYMRLARSQAGQESDLQRKQELQEIADTLEAIREHPPQTFAQALQLFWLTCVALQIESNASSISIGRFDQFLLPFFTKDIEQERLDYKQAHLLLACLWIKMNEVVFLRSQDSARYFGGFPTGYNMVLGGVTSEGWDGTNPLSYLCLDITSQLRLPQPNLSVRVHQSTPTSFLRKSSELVAKGFGLPQFFNDDTIIDTLVRQGVSREDAKSYGIVGCVQLSIPGKMYGMPDVVLFNLLKCLELVIHQGTDPLTGIRYPVVLNEGAQDSFEAFEQSVLATIRHYVNLACASANLVDLAQRRFSPVPFLSCLMAGCIESGRDMTEGGTTYNVTGVQQVGIANLADSMMVIKKVVFEDRVMTLDRLSALLRSNFDKAEPIRRQFVRDYPKYGNDCAEVDDLASRYLREFCGYVWSNENPRGGKFSPGSYTVSAHIPMGHTVGATPDGRTSGEKLADGGLAPGSGLAKLGPVSLLRTISRLDSELLSNGSLLNMRFSQSSFASTDSFEQFFHLVKLFIKLKLIHIQFSVLDGETLREARANPDLHPELLVRVGGYSAYFKDLSVEVQDDLIDRCQYNMELSADE